MRQGAVALFTVSVLAAIVYRLAPDDLTSLLVVVVSLVLSFGVLVLLAGLAGRERRRGAFVLTLVALLLAGSAWVLGGRGMQLPYLPPPPTPASAPTATPPPTAIATTPVPVPLPPTIAGLPAKDAMMVAISTIVLLSSIFVILSNRYKDDTQKWAFGAVGTIIGFWLKG